MPSDAERTYELATAALAEQERSVIEIRGRVPALLAGIAVVGTLLARPAVEGSHPDGIAESITLVAGVTAAAVALACCVAIFGLYKLVFSLDALSTYDALEENGLLRDEERRDLALAFNLTEYRRINETKVRRLRRLLVVALLAFFAEAALLGVAAALTS